MIGRGNRNPLRPPSRRAPRIAPRRYRGESRHGPFADLRLASSPLHDRRCDASDRTAVQVIAGFIKPLSYAQGLNTSRISRLAASADQYRPACDAIARCRPGARCGCCACAVCFRIFQVWAASQALACASMGVPTRVVVIKIKEVAAGDLTMLDTKRAGDRLRKDLLRAGLRAALGHLEVAYKPGRASWCLHAHLLLFGPCEAALKRLRTTLKRRGLARAVDDRPLRRPVRQISYLFKFVTYYRCGRRNDPYPLGRRQLEQLLDWSDASQITDRLFLLGFQRRGAIVPGAHFRKLRRDASASGQRLATWRRGDATSPHSGEADR